MAYGLLKTFRRRLFLGGAGVSGLVKFRFVGLASHWLITSILFQSNRQGVWHLFSLR